MSFTLHLDQPSDWSQGSHPQTQRHQRTAGPQDSRQPRCELRAASQTTPPTPATGTSTTRNGGQGCCCLCGRRTGAAGWRCRSFAW